MRLKLAAETRFEFEEVAPTVRLFAGVSTSPTIKLIGLLEVSSSIVSEGMLEMLGGSFTELTITWKLRVVMLLEAPPSFTVTVMMAVPFAFLTVSKLKLPADAGLE